MRSVWTEGERTESNRASSARVSTIFTGLPSAFAASAAGQRFRAEDLPRAQGIVGTATAAGGMPRAAADLKPDDLVRLPGGMQTSVRNAELQGFIVRDANGGYRNAGPQVTEPTPQEAQAAREAGAKAAHEASEAATREQAELNTHPHPEIEAAHASFAQLPTQDAVSLLVKAHRGQSPTEADVHRIAESMGVTPDVATDRLRALNAGIEGQFGALARANGVDPDAAADWIRTRRQSEALTAVRDHVLGRNLKAWAPLIAAYKAAGGR